MKKIIAASLVAIAGTFALSGCSSDADTVSHNLSKDADNFEVVRRVVLYNGVTGEYVLAVVGKCSLNNDAGDSVTCKMDDGQYVKHIFRMGDNMTLFAEQLGTKDASSKRYKVYFKPEQIIPDIERGGTN